MSLIRCFAPLISVLAQNVPFAGRLPVRLSPREGPQLGSGAHPPRVAHVMQLRRPALTRAWRRSPARGRTPECCARAQGWRMSGRCTGRARRSPRLSRSSHALRCRHTLPCKSQCVPMRPNALASPAHRLAPTAGAAQGELDRAAPHCGALARATRRRALRVCRGLPAPQPRPFRPLHARQRGASRLPAAYAATSRHPLMVRYGRVGRRVR